MLENRRMESGRSIMRRAISRLLRASPGNSIATFIVAACVVYTGLSGPLHAQVCDKPVYLTFDTGHMGTAPLIAEVLKRHNVKATFFAANERTQTGDGSLGNHWAPWWKARAAEGHEFASHTYDHVYWRGDVKGVEPKFRMQPSSGAFEGREFTWDAKKYCEQIAYAAERIGDHTGVKPLPLVPSLSKLPATGTTSMWTPHPGNKRPAQVQHQRFPLAEPSVPAPTTRKKKGPMAQTSDRAGFT